MRDTFDGRRYEILNTPVTEEIVKSWPRILNTHVIDEDFIQLYTEKSADAFCSEFGLLSAQIIVQAKNCGQKEAENIATKFPYDLTNQDFLSQRACCVLQLLPFLLPQGTITKQIGQKKRKIRPTCHLSLSHFIEFIPIGVGVDKFMLEDRTLGGERKQPFILAIGEKYDPTQVFVVLENNCLECTSMVKAVDLCFKLTYILNLEFSPYCRNVWQFINDIFFKCEFSAKLPSCIVELKNRIFVHQE